ncbi:hypothetical protein HYFRA_00008699 [Hymenoscyphus fraxineus]|uniref:Uncharacterized protein n=1 Tax=Hymenoscyphus fraxineus TaxID=746836 RepID=A0A9N9PQJ4_9HELO|nr:hypothetical protein HYFRA_00008699 [Hymenoscyphus fraxineus]
MAQIAFAEIRFARHSKSSITFASHPLVTVLIWLYFRKHFISRLLIRTSGFASRLKLTEKAYEASNVRLKAPEMGAL